MGPASSRQRPEMLLLVVFSLAGISLLVPSALAIRCHQCNSALDQDCEDVVNNTAYLKDCEEDNRISSEAFCRKMVLKVLYDGNTRIIRGCGWEKSRQSCYRYDDDDHNQMVCECFEEGCNSAPGRLAVLLPLTFLLTLLARL